MNANELRFPILGVAPKGLVRAWRSSKDFQTTTTWHGYRRGYFQRLTIIDREGDVFRVTEAKRRRVAGKLWDPRGGWLPFFDPYVEVQIDVQQAGTKKLAELKQELSQEIRKHKGYWSSEGITVERVSSTRSFPELFESFLMEGASETLAPRDSL